MKNARFISAACLFGLVLTSPLQAQTAEDCISEFQALQAQFDLAAPGAERSCARQANTISLDAEGPLPEGCVGRWDHWHLEARAVGGNEGFCSMMLRGLEDQEGCGTELFKLDLPANEAAAWRKFLDDECAS